MTCEYDENGELRLVSDEAAEIAGQAIKSRDKDAQRKLALDFMRQITEDNIKKKKAQKGG